MTEKKPLKVQYVQTDKLVPYVNNARVHDEHQINQIAASIKEFGFNNPILTDGDNGVVAGHGRLYAALKLGLQKVPVIELSHLTPAQKKAYILADNRIAENARWDNQLLRIEAEELGKMGFDLSLTGFSSDEINQFLGLEEDSEQENPYTSLIETPQYDIQGTNPDIVKLFDTEKTKHLISEIETTPDISEEEREFLIAAAYRHTVFNYKNIAEYYAAASPRVQALMQKSALVIIDFNDAIANGYVKLTAELKKIAGIADAA